MRGCGGLVLARRGEGAPASWGAVVDRVRCHSDRHRTQKHSRHATMFSRALLAAAAVQTAAAVVDDFDSVLGSHAGFPVVAAKVSARVGRRRPRTSPSPTTRQPAPRARRPAPARETPHERALAASAEHVPAGARALAPALTCAATRPRPHPQAGANTYTYMSVADPNALNLDGSIYGIAVCLSSTSKANWTCVPPRAPPPRPRPPTAPLTPCPRPAHAPPTPSFLLAVFPRTEGAGVIRSRSATRARRRRWAPTRRGPARPRAWRATLRRRRTLRASSTATARRAPATWRTPLPCPATRARRCTSAASRRSTRASTCCCRWA